MRMLSCVTSFCTSSSKCAHVVSQQMHPMQDGIIAAGLANGVIEIWDPAKLAAGKGEAARITKLDKHKGPVRSYCHLPALLLKTPCMLPCSRLPIDWAAFS